MVQLGDPEIETLKFLKRDSIFLFSFVSNFILNVLNILFLILYHCILKIWTKNSLHLIILLTKHLQIEEKEKTGGKQLTTAMHVLRICYNKKYHVNWDSILWTVNGGFYDINN